MYPVCMLLYFMPQLLVECWQLLGYVTDFLTVFAELWFLATSQFLSIVTWSYYRQGVVLLIYVCIQGIIVQSLYFLTILKKLWKFCIYLGNYSKSISGWLKLVWIMNVYPSPLQPFFGLPCDVFLRNLC